MTVRQHLVVLTALCLPSVCPAESATEIREATGVEGGMIVHLGCGDGTLTASLGDRDGYLVHGLDVDQEHVAAARQLIKSRGLYGRVSAMQLTSTRLPYASNLVNLVVSDNPNVVSFEEILRVLCPGGVAYLKVDDKWTKTVKPWTKGIDEWTHFLHGPDNNAVAHDSVVDLPRRLKWLGAPKYARAHEQAASLTACVTTGGRLFYIVDEAPPSDVRIPSQWSLIARDAFNGVILWKRSIPRWINRMRRFRSGPSEMAFRLAAKDDRVYVTLGLAAPVSILDAATGQTIANCEGTENARQILRLGDKLIVLVDPAPESTREADSQIRRGLKPSPGKRVIVVADEPTGRQWWRKEIDLFVHPTMAAQGRYMFYQTTQELHCIDVDSGGEVWKTDRPLALKGHELGWESPTLVVNDEVVYSADFKQIVAYAIEDGSVLWKAASRAGYNSPPDVFVIDNIVWLKGKQLTGLDSKTGEVKKTLRSIGGYMHPRCYRNKATDRFFILGNQGVQFVDRRANDAWPHHWMRGTCQYGIMPANGMLYVTPDSCACNMKSKLSGFWAIESDVAQKSTESTRPAERLIRGSAYGEISSPTTKASVDDVKSWPVYRHDWSRSGMTRATVESSLTQKWQTKVGGKLSGVTVANGRLFVAAVDAHTVYSLDQESGETLWTYTAGSRVDSPPTIYNGMSVFGSADGWVYSLRASDGELVWRFRVAPEVKLTFVNGQLESVWPVHGSVMVHNDRLLVTAGRSSYLDGGIRVCQIDPTSGRLISETTMFSPDPNTGKQPADANTKDVRGVLSDVLLAEEDDVYMRHVKLDMATGDHSRTGMHLFSPTGLLDDSWWHRTYWLFNEEFVSHWSGWWKAGNVVPSGRILSYDATSIFGYGRDKYPAGNTGQARGGEAYRLFACDRPTTPVTSKQLSARRRKKGSKLYGRKPIPTAYRWENTIPFHVRAMVIAGDTIFAAGPPELAKPGGIGENALVLKNPIETLEAWQGQRGGELWAISTTDGKSRAEYSLDSPPVFDGMAAIEGRIYMSTTNGQIVCFSN